jgi:tight adherence protein B
MTILLSLLVFAIVALILLGAITLSGKGPDNTVRRRLEAIEKGARRGNNSPELKLLRDQLLSGVPLFNRWLLSWDWAARLRKFVTQSGVEILPGRLILGSAVAGASVYLALVTFYSSIFFGLLGGCLAALVPIAFVAYKRSKRLGAFEKGFPAAISLLSRAMRAGVSFTAALEMAAKELADPVGGEFRIVFDEQNFGLPLRETLLNLADRVPLMDVRFFVTALLIQHETGGNLVELFDNLGYLIRDRFRILGDIRVRTAQSRLTAMILIALPVTILIAMHFLNPDYTGVLFTDVWGHYLLAGGVVLQIIGAVVLWKIVNIEV